MSLYTLNEPHTAVNGCDVSANSAPANGPAFCAKMARFTRSEIVASSKHQSRNLFLVTPVSRPRLPAIRPDHIVPDTSFALSPKTAAHMLSISRRALDMLITSGKLSTRKIGGRTVVDYEGLKSYYASLPPKVTRSIPNVPQCRRHRQVRKRIAQGVR